jgi:hypothetical protein
MVIRTIQVCSMPNRGERTDLPLRHEVAPCE